MPDENPPVLYEMTLSASICVSMLKPHLKVIHERLSSGRIGEALEILEHFMSKEGMDELDHAVLRLRDETPEQFKERLGQIDPGLH